MGKLTIVLGLLCLLLPAGAARAQDDDDDDNGNGEDGFDRPGWYVAIAATYAIDNFSKQGVFQSGEKVSTHHDPSWGGNVRGGYRFNPIAAFEVEWEGLDGFDDTSGTGTEIDGWSVTGNLKAHLPLGRIQPYVLGGVGMLQARTHGGGVDSDVHESFLLRGGGGFDLYLTENVVFASDVSYLFPTEDNDGLDHISVSWGVLFRF